MKSTDNKLAAVPIDKEITVFPESVFIMDGR